MVIHQGPVTETYSKPVFVPTGAGMTIGERLVQQQKKAEIANADLTAMKLRQQRRLEYMEVRNDSL